MIYCSIDIETTGLDPENCDIIEFAAILDDLSQYKPIENLPKFHAYFMKDTYQGEPYALSMHSKIFQKISQKNGNVMKIEELPYAFKNFLTKNGINEDNKINIAGKNAAMFDLPFLNKKIKNWDGIRFSHRIIDPSILYYQPGDNYLPDTKTCMERAGIPGEVEHTALEDALIIVKLIRKKFNNLTVFETLTHGV
jgi:DNA polymerase III epsilon subunit-like protein